MAGPEAEARPCLELRRQLAAPRERVFAAWTDAEFVAQWFGPSDAMRVSAEIDLRVGGSYRFVIRSEDDDKTHIVVGEYREIDPPSRLAFTWAWVEGGGDAAESLVTVELRERDGGTELLLRHERFGSADARDHHRQGWTGTFDRLERFLASGGSAE